MSLRVAITRAAPEAEKTAARVRALGHEPVLTPLLTISPRAFDANIAGAQALLFTSTNGVRAFTNASASRAIAVVAVGGATAAAAHEAGFTDVRSADGDVAALAALAAGTLHPARGALIHITGADAAGDLVGALAAAGFQAERRTAYEARAATALPPGFAQPLDVVVFHSARAAGTFIALGAPNAAQMTAACLSPAVARAAANSPQGAVRWARLIVSPAPREDALLASGLTPANT